MSNSGEANKYSPFVSQGADTASDELQVALRDLWVTNAGIMVLITALNPNQSNTIVFALGK